MTFQDDNGNSLEISGDFAMTKKAISVFSFSISGDVSINFKVDSNSENRKTLGYYGPRMNNQIAFVKQAFNRKRQGNILDRGYIVIQDDFGDYLDCFYVSGNSNWIQLMDRLVTELSYDIKYELFWNYFEGIVYPEGVALPYLDVFDGKGGNKAYAGVPYPVFYLTTLIKEIFANNLLKISGNLLDDPNFKSLALTPQKGQLERSNFGNYYAYGNDQGITNAFSVYTSYRAKSDTRNRIDINNSFVFTNDQDCYVNVYVVVTCVEPTTIRLEDSLGGTVDTTINGNTDVWGADHKLVLSNTTQTYLLGGVGYYLQRGQSFRLSVKANTATTPNFRFDSIRFEITKEIIAGDSINPPNYLPTLACIDVIKYAVATFGCSVYFNDVSRTVSFNIIDKIQKENALVWSEYYVSHRSEYTVVAAKNNYYRVQDPDESRLKSYNSANSLGFGEANLSTSNTLKDNYEVYKSPFAATEMVKGKSSFWLPRIGLQSFSDNGTGIAFTSIVSGGGTPAPARFTAAAGTWANLASGSAVRIVSGRIDLGVFFCDSVTSTYITCSELYFTGTNTGTIYLQALAYNTVQPRILSVAKATPIPYFSDYPQIAGVSTYDLAWFVKPKTGYPLDSLIGTAAYDNPIGYSDTTIKEQYLKTFSKFLSNPAIRFQMLLPEAVYQSFDFSQFIYIKSADLIGYFFVESIVNYIDGKTPVEVNCYMI